MIHIAPSTLSGPHMMILVNIHFICKMMEWVHSFMEFLELLLCARHRDKTVTVMSIFSAFTKLTCQRGDKIGHQRQT